MKPPWSVVKHPLLSEKSMKKQDAGVYTFAVDRDANKPEIKHAIEQIYGVKVETVQTIMIKGKIQRTRNFVMTGRRKDWKKAYVKLKPGFRLDII